MPPKYTLNALYTNVRYNNKTYYNDNLNERESLAEDEMNYWRYKRTLYLTHQETYILDIC